MSANDPLALSVVIASNRSEGSRKLIAALTGQLADSGVERWEIILVLDGCPRHAWLDQHTDQRLRPIALPRRHGIARARNIGVNHARGELIAFLDDDCVPGPRWLATLLRLSADYPDHVAFGGPVIGTDEVNVFSQLREQVYYRETFGDWYVTADPADRVGAPYVNGGNAAYRRPGLPDPLFDPLLPAYSDVELGRRLRLTERAVLSRDMCILHDHPSRARTYLERCHRSGRARGVLWAARRYPQEHPARVLGAVVRNIFWSNPVRRTPRINAAVLVVLSVLTLQEVLHALGYIQALAAGPHRGDRTRGRDDRAPGHRDGPGPA